LNKETIQELRLALDAANNDSKTGVVILTGSGEKSFVAGADIKEFADFDTLQGKELAAKGQALLFDFIENMSKPVIAAINGFALGGGCEMALSCDFRILDDHVKIGLPETRLGAVAGAGGVQKLARHVGRGKALDWILRGLHIDAQTADKNGLCSAVVPGEKLLQTALDLALEMRKLGPKAIAQSKRSVYLSEDADLRTARRFGIEALSMLVGGDEWKEGMKAFIEKTPPAFDKW
jgi:enoyl-CoA hydratase/carnithine racemase